MELDSTSQIPDRSNQDRAAPAGNVAWAAALKLAILGALVLVLLVPVSQILDLVRERADRLSGVRAELATAWGGPQALGAAILSLPIRPPAPAPALDVRFAPAPPVPPRRRAYLLPADVRWRGTVTPEVRRRGLFEAAVYVAELELDGSFGPPDLGALGLAEEDVLWDDATLILGVADPKAITERPRLGWAGVELPLGPTAPGQPLDGLVARLGGAMPRPGGGPVAFTASLAVRGSEALRFLPLGDLTTVELKSPWPDPGFDGAVLPGERRIGPAGFEARWEVPFFGRGYPRSWIDDEGATSASLAASAFGVSLVLPADQYQQTERAVKYAALFIVLTFTTLFLLELLAQERIHPVQYLLVGFALCLFYQLLLALAEHTGFARAYLAASIATTALIALYARSLLGSWRRIGVLAGVLGLLYGYLFALLRAEDLALLIGSLGLFLVLAAVMYLTRRLDWYTLRFETAGSRP